MDRLTDDLRRALAAGALAADSDLVSMGDVYDGISRRRRRRLAVVSVAAAVAMLGAGGAFALQRDDHTTARVAGDPTPTPTLLNDGRVPWLALPPPTMPSPTDPTPSSLPTARECQRGDVRYEDKQTDGAAGTKYTVFAVSNTSHTACTLSDSPAISVQGTGGQGDVRHEKGLFPGGQTPATIGPAETAHIAVATSLNCSGTPTSYGDIELILKDGYPLATQTTIESSCGLRVGEWFVQPSGPTEPPTPYASLSASIEDAPLDPKPGTTLDYTVVLHNNGTQTVQLPDPCPAYRELISDGGQGGTSDVTYGLNCAGWNGSLAAGASVRLQMKLDIPAGLTRPVKWFWVLIGPDNGSGLSIDLAASRLGGAATVPGSVNPTP